MGYNVDLEDKIDRLKERLGEIAKKKMFGGVGYLINGNMCFGIYRESLVLRTSPEKAEELMRRHMRLGREKFLKELEKEEQSKG